MLCYGSRLCGAFNVVAYMYMYMHAGQVPVHTFAYRLTGQALLLLGRVYEHNVHLESSAHRNNTNLEFQLQYMYMQFQLNQTSWQSFGVNKSANAAL